MIKAEDRARKQLSGGGEAFMNRLGRLWLVDVFDIDDELIYHAAYNSRDDAIGDLDSWQGWPGEDGVSFHNAGLVK